MKPDSSPPPPQRERMILDLLESVENGSQKTQRDLAREFDVALGMVNAYLKYCIKKGLIRIKKIPSRRYLYFLTPSGFAEKSRLSLKLMSNSLLSFRQARHEYDAAFSRLNEAGCCRIVLVGYSELSEIAILCALNQGTTIAAVVDPDATDESFVNVPVVKTFDEAGEIDGAVLTDLRRPQIRYDQTVARLGAHCVIAPSILGIREANLQ